MTKSVSDWCCKLGVQVQLFYPTVLILLDFVMFSIKWLGKGKWCKWCCQVFLLMLQSCIHCVSLFCHTKAESCHCALETSYKRNFSLEISEPSRVFPPRMVSKAERYILNPSIQASLSTKKQPHNQYEGLLCFARGKLGKEKSVMFVERRQEIATSNIPVASPQFIFLKALGGWYNQATHSFLIFCSPECHSGPDI